MAFFVHFMLNSLKEAVSSRVRLAGEGERRMSSEAGHTGQKTKKKYSRVESSNLCV